MGKEKQIVATPKQVHLDNWKQAWHDLIELAAHQPGGAAILNGMYCGLSGGMLVDENGNDIFNRKTATKDVKAMNKRFLGLLEADADIDDDDDEDEDDLLDDEVGCDECDDPKCDEGSICQVKERKELFTVRYKQRSFGKGLKAKSIKIGKWFVKAENAKEAKRRFGMLKLAHGGVVSVKLATLAEIVQFGSSEDD